MEESVRIPTGKAELIQHILEEQLKLQRSMRDESPREWLALGLTIAQLKSLFVINFEGEINPKRLANALGVTPPNVTGIVDRLVEQDLITREYNQLNRREQKLRLTSKGEDLVDRLYERASLRLTKLLERLDTQDLAALARGLRALNRATQEQLSSEERAAGERAVNGRAEESK